MNWLLYQNHNPGKSSFRKRQRLEENGETHRPRTRSISSKEDPYEAIQEAKKELEIWECKKQQTKCMELTSFLFDFFCQEVILSEIPTSVEHDWFESVREIMHRAYMKEKLTHSEQQLAQCIEEAATPKYFTHAQWGYFLNLNVSIGQLSGHKKMNQKQLCARVKELALQWLEDEAQQTVLSLVTIMEKISTNQSMKQKAKQILIQK